ncbi:MAG: hypothetical protein ACYTG7_16055 [Planctomycetota bacterium]|jgi:hypothetical protein
MLKHTVILILLVPAFVLLSSADCFAGDESWKDEAVRDAVEGLTARLGAEHGPRIERGVRRVARLWQNEDGGRDKFHTFVNDYFVVDPEALDAAFLRFEKAFESIHGYMHQIYRDMKEPIDLDTGPLLPLDTLLALYSPSDHLEEDFFQHGIAFFLALNFPRYSLEEKLRLGPEWTRRQWAMARLGDRFFYRIPAGNSMNINPCMVECQQYVYEYNFYLNRFLTEDMKPLFPEGLRLLQHWGMRDEIRGRYADPEGLARQEMIYQVMLRVIGGTIPAQVVNEPGLWWEPHGNRLYSKDDGRYAPVEDPHEPDRRYELLWKIFETFSLLDEFYPDNPTVMDRVFNLDRQIPEAEVERLLVSILSSPVALRVGRLIEKRLERPLRPFDIWYNGFKLAGAWDEAALDKITRERYPTARAFEKDLYNILRAYGFAAEKARFLSDRITVDASRGSGHAMPAAMRTDKAHLRTRVGKAGMDYKGFNIALHELGHNVEQVFALHGMDFYSLRGVPNNGFTEALAIMLQNRDLEILGLEEKAAKTRDSQILDTYWTAMEIGGVGLVEMKVWRWMYAHPDAGPEELKTATLDIAREVWNAYFAPVIQVDDSPILAVYSHMLSDPTYLPNYFLGHIILFQLETHLQGKDFAEEVERMFRQGDLTPNLWMTQAVGSGISTKPLLEAAEAALDRFGG